MELCYVNNGCVLTYFWVKLSNDSAWSVDVLLDILFQDHALLEESLVLNASISDPASYYQVRLCLSPTGALLLCEIYHSKTSELTLACPRLTVLTATASYKWIPILRKLIEFRNSYSMNPILFKQVLLESELKHLKQTRYALTHVRWPCESDCKLEYNPTTCETSITSIDTYVTLLLHAHRQSFSVHYPIPVYSQSRNCEDNKYSYIWMEQSYSIYECPLFCHYPLSVLLNKHRDPLPFPPLPTPTLSYVQSPLSHINESSMLPSSPDNRVLPFTLIPRPPHLQQAWPTCFEKSIQIDKNCFLVLPDKSVFIQFHDTSCCLVSPDATFATHFHSLVARDCMQESGWGWKQEPEYNMYYNGLAHYAHYQDSVYDIQQVFTVSVRLVQAMPSIQPRMHKETIKIKPGRVHVQGVGVFEIQVTGHMVVRFDDRIVVQVDPTSVQDPYNPNACATITDAYGDTSIVRLTRSIGYERHIQHLLQFRRWALSSDFEKYSHSQKRELKKSQIVSILSKSKKFVQECL